MALSHRSHEEAGMRIEVDHDRCEGFGECEQAAPQVLRLGEERAEILLDPVPDELATAAGSAVRACPRGALRAHS